MTDRKKPGAAFWASVVLAAVLLPSCAYLGAYLLIVEPIRESRSYPLIGVRWAVHPHYRAFGTQDYWRAFFEPANSLDKRIRVKTWAFE
jgi:hypothetical protein